MGMIRKGIGIVVQYGTGNTPGFFNNIIRTNPETNRDTYNIFMPLSAIPRTGIHNRPREASPTGKSGMGIATYSQTPQPIYNARRKSVLPRNPNYTAPGEGKMTTQQVIDPYESMKKVQTPILSKKLLG